MEVCCDDCGYCYNHHPFYIKSVLCLSLKGRFLSPCTQQREDFTLARLRPLKLAHIEAIIETSLFQQLCVRALLNTLTTINDENQISAPNGTKAMSDNVAGTPLHQPEQSLLNMPLRTSINATRRLIQNQNRRIRKNSPSAIDKLPLTLTEVTT